MATHPPTPLRPHHATAAWFAAAGLAFAGYPLLRPWGPESGLRGAEDFASTAWVLSHVLGMVGFVALALGLRAAARGQAVGRAPWSWTGHPVHKAESRAWLAVALLLPYYGAEAYGLQAVGSHALEHDAAGVLAIADTFRYAPVAVGTFGTGLLLLVLVGARLAHGLWHAGPRARAGGLASGLALATYLPQFFTAPEVRVAHGILLGVGLLLVAAGTRPTPATSQARSTPTASSSAAA